MKDEEPVNEGLRARNVKKARAALVMAIEQGDLALLARALADGANPFEQDKSGWCQWMMAAKKGRLEVLDALAKHGEKTMGSGALAALRDGGAKTLLHHAVESRDGRVLGWALSLGIDVDAQSVDGSSALMLASAYGADFEGVNPVEKLLGARANSMLKDHEGLTALMHSCRRGNVEGARSLLSQGLEACVPNALCELGRSAAYLAIQSQERDLVTLMMAKGVLKPESWVCIEHVKGEGPKRVNALMAAAERRVFDVVDLLITPKAAMAVGEGGKDALMFLAGSGNWNRLMEMARSIAPLSDLSRKDAWGRTAEQVGRKNNMVEFADYIAALHLARLELKALQDTVVDQPKTSGVQPVRARL